MKTSLFASDTEYDKEIYRKNKLVGDDAWFVRGI